MGRSVGGGGKGGRRGVNRKEWGGGRGMGRSVGGGGKGGRRGVNRKEWGGGEEWGGQ